MNWRQKFVDWSVGPDDTEKQKLDRVVKDISETLRNDPGLKNRDTESFPQGSYANRVNVKKDSDVDVCSLYRNVFYYVVPTGTQITDFVSDFVPATYDYFDYKNAVERALVDRYGQANVKRGNKAIDVNSKERDVDADVVPAFEYRDFRVTFNQQNGVLGTCLVSDDGKLITNFPQQQYDNGVLKHQQTGRRFKRQVRIQKNLRNHMEEAGEASAKPIKSFLLESLCWNAPNHCYGKKDYFEDFEAVMKWLYEATDTDATASGLREVNGIKFLFGNENAWTRQQVRLYVEAAWTLTH